MPRQSRAGPTVIRAGDVLPGQSYPFLPEEWGWEIHSTPLDALTALGGQPEPTLRLVKDDKVVDVVVPGMDSAAFLAHWGLALSMARGGYVLSKRLSRLLQPYRYWTLCAPEQVEIAHVRAWDGRTWDGCGRVSRLWLIEHILPTLAALPDGLRQRYEQELWETERWEITLVYEGGQEKGDVLVVGKEMLPGGVDFAFPAGSAKREVRMAGRRFVGLAQARHAKLGMRLDPQSLVNLHPFVEPEQLLEWLEMESALFLEGVETGRAGRLYSRLACDEARLASLARWHVAEYLASGGDARWFAGISRALGRQHLRRLVDQVEGKVRFPAPGGRFYLFPAAVGGLEVAHGTARLDVARATVWLNDRQWRDEIVPLLGGCDGDDAAWVLGFTDHDGARRLLLWRSPNQLGEYVLLAPDPAGDEIRWALAGGGTLAWPALDSRHLPLRVDEVPYEYAALPMPPARRGRPPTYRVAAMEETIRLAQANRGVLGAFCNLMMVTKALYGRLPLRLPATLETIIDGSVKRFVDLTPVRAWVTAGATAIARQGTPVPLCLAGRLAPLLPKRSPRLRYSYDHWLDRLMAGVAAHRADYEARLEALACRAMPPAEFFLAISPEGRTVGSELRARYAAILRDGGTPTAARRACEALLDALPEEEQGPALLAAAACCYGAGAEELSDNVVWQLGARRAGGGREDGIAQGFLAALRAVGLIGEPLWTSAGALLYWDGEIGALHPAVAVTLNGAWFNRLRLIDERTPDEMGAVPPATRRAAKAAMARLAEGPLVGTELTVGQEGERLVLRGPCGHLVGYVPREQEGRLADAATWRVVWASAEDGNVQAVLVAS